MEIKPIDGKYIQVSVNKSMMKQQMQTLRFLTSFVCLFFIVILFQQKAVAQTLGINTTGALPDSSAMLDILSPNRGLLIPRVSLTSTSDTTTILNPATSLLVYNTNPSITGGSGLGYYYYNGSMWMNFLSGTGNSLTTPLIIGGSGTTSSLTYKPTTGVGTTGADHIFKVGNNGATEAMRILNNASIGIGTSTPTQKLHLNGHMALTGNPASVRYILVDETNVGTTQLIMQAGAGSSGYGGAMNLYGHSHTTKPGWVTAGISVSAGTGATEGRFTINNQALGGGTDVFTVLRSGNVGIGTTTPLSKLDVVGAAGVASFTGTTRLGVTIEGSTASTNIVGIDFLGDIANVGNNPLGRIGMYRTANGSYLQFGTSNSWAGGITNQALTIDYTGNIGIGTSTPNMALEIDKALPLIRYRRTGAYNWNAGVGNGTTNIPSSYFGIEDVSTLAARLVIAHTSGYVGMGTTAPGQLLHLEQGTTGAGLTMRSFSTTIATTNSISLLKGASNTKATYTATGTGDVLGEIIAYGSDAANSPSNIATKIEFVQTAAAGAANVPADMVFYTGTNAAAATERARINSDGRVGIGASPQVYSNLYIGKTATGSTAWHNVMSDVVIQSDVTGNFRNFSSFPSTQAAAFTLASLSHFEAYQGTIGAGSAVTNQYGFNSESTITGAATINAGFRGNIAAAANRWNCYMVGTAQNYFAGNVGIGITAPTNKLHIYSNTAAQALFNGYSTLTSGVGDYNGTILIGNQATYQGVIDYNGSAPTALTIKNTYAGNTNSKIQFNVGGTDIVSMLKSGNVGIGTTTPNSTLQVNGAISLPIVNVTGNYTVLSTDYTIYVSGGSAGVTTTVTLPTLVAGRIYVIKNASLGDVSLVGTIDSGTNLTISAAAMNPPQPVMVQGLGGAIGWVVISRQ